MTEVIELYSCNDPDNVLQKSISEFDSVIIIGYLSDDGSLDVRASIGSKMEINYMIDRVKHKLLSGDYDA